MGRPIWKETYVISGCFGRTVARSDKTTKNLGSVPGDRAGCGWSLSGSMLLHQENVGSVRFFCNLVGFVVGEFWERLSSAKVGENAL